MSTLPYTHTVIFSFDADSNNTVIVAEKTGKGVETPHIYGFILFDAVNESVANELKGYLEDFLRDHPFSYNNHPDLRPMFLYAIEQVQGRYEEFCGITPPSPEQQQDAPEESEDDDWEDEMIFVSDEDLEHQANAAAEFHGGIDHDGRRFHYPDDEDDGY